MKRIGKRVEEFEGVMLDHTVLATLRYLQHPDTVNFYTDLLDKCISAAIKSDEVFSDEDALEIIRGLTNLKEDLGNLLIAEEEAEAVAEVVKAEEGENTEESGKEAGEWEE